MVRHVNKDCGKQTIADLEQDNKVLKNELNTCKSLLKRIANKEDLFSWELEKYRR